MRKKFHWPSYVAFLMNVLLACLVVNEFTRYMAKKTEETEMGIPAMTTLSETDTTKELYKQVIRLEVQNIPYYELLEMSGLTKDTPENRKVLIDQYVELEINKGK